MSNNASKFLIYTIKGGLLILPVLSFIVSGVLFFPFITGKAFFFRTVVEILFFLWILLAVFDPKYRPKKSPVLFALAAVIVVLSLATIFGENPYRSFWSNYERMEGLVSHLHLFAYFLILTSVFKKEKDFKWLFASITTAGAILSGYAYLQLMGKITVHQGGVKLDATLGNSTYFAIFIIFHLFILSWLFLKNKNIYLRSLFVFLFAFETPLVFYTLTRGAILGLFGGVALFSVLSALLNKNKKIRLTFAGIFIVLALLSGLFLIFKNSAIVQKNSVLNKIASISLKQRTVESRLTIWSMGYEGFKEHPILGWGPENFNLVFNKYYKPNMYKQEPWFDRAHDIVFDWLISSGILGLLAYLSIFISAIYILIKKKISNEKIEFALFMALFAVYGFHNLFVFDNLTSYYLFFTVLGYVHYAYTKEMGVMNGANGNNNNNSRALLADEIGISQYIIITGSFLLIVFSLYFVNLKPYLAGKQILISLQEASQNPDTEKVLSSFDEVFSYHTFGTPEGREQLSGYASGIIDSEQIKQDKKVKVVSRAIQEMEQQVKDAPDDARYYIFLGTLYARVNRNDDALKTLTKALELSPKKQQIYFLLADVYLAKGENAKAFQIMQDAYNLDKTYTEAVRNLALVLILNNKEKEAEDLLQENFGKRVLIDTQFVNAYARINDFEKVKEIWLGFIEQEPNNPQYHISLAATYIQLKERENAISELQKSIEINPQFKQQGEYYINEIRAGRNP